MVSLQSGGWIIVHFFFSFGEAALYALLSLHYFCGGRTLPLEMKKLPGRIDLESYIAMLLFLEICGLVGPCLLSAVIWVRPSRSGRRPVGDAVGVNWSELAAGRGLERAGLRPLERGWS